MAAPQLFTIERPGAGRLSTMAAPDGEAQLGPFIHALRGQGVDVLVSLLPPKEEGRLGLAREATVADQAGIDFLRLPTRDFRAPELAATQALAVDLVERLQAGKHVVIHCRGGVGRSSTLAAAVLVHEGLDPDEAWRWISAARGTHVPETRSQRKVIAQLGVARAAN